MNMPADVAPERAPAIEIRFGQIGLVQVRVRTTDPGAIVDELTGRIATAPRFFERTAACLDLGALTTAPEAGALRGVLDAIRRAGLLCVGLAHGSAGVDALASALGLPVLMHFRAQNPAVPVLKPVEPAASAQAPAAALVHSQPVRSGQRLYARDRDLIVMATIGAGAEVMADGCVHIYGSLRGRAMAGAHGQTGARVFCQEFHAELVSIAGVFRVFETIPGELSGKPVQIWLEGDSLHLARIGA
jgi:septum site-determining protein MinC